MDYSDPPCCIGHPGAVISAGAAWIVQILHAALVIQERSSLQVLQGLSRSSLLHGHPGLGISIGVAWIVQIFHAALVI